MWIGGAACAAVLVAGGTLLQSRPALKSCPVAETGQAQGVRLVFLGTASAVLSDGRDTVVVDGFVTRPPVWRLAFMPLRSDAVAVDTARRASSVDAVSAVLVAHSHFDHALDAAQWARAGAGQVWGTASSVRIAEREGVPGHKISAGAAYRIGDIGIDVFALDHSPGGRMEGDISADFDVPARTLDYRNGGGHGYRLSVRGCRILVIPSAGLPQTDLSDLPADVVMLAIGQLGLQSRDYIEDYWARTVVASGARRVYVTHWDDFTRPLGASLVALPYAVDRIDRAMQVLMVLAGDAVQIQVPQPYQSLALAPVCGPL